MSGNQASKIKKKIRRRGEKHEDSKKRKKRQVIRTDMVWNDD